jgi:hypothetical protein
VFAQDGERLRFQAARRLTRDVSPCRSDWIFIWRHARASARADLSVRVAALVVGACPSSLAAEVRPRMAARGAEAERYGMGAVVESTLERWFTQGSAPGCVRSRCAFEPKNYAHSAERHCDKLRHFGRGRTHILASRMVARVRDGHGHPGFSQRGKIHASGARDRCGRRGSWDWCF